MVRQKRKSKPRKLVTDAKLTGLFYSIDPSSGGGDSNPAVAIWRNGILQEIREIKLPRTILERRLSTLLTELLTWDEPDIWAIEEIPPYIKTPAGSTVNFSLHKSVGIFQGVWGHIKMIKIPIQAWKKEVVNVKGYVKSDSCDSVLIGYTALKEGGVNVKVNLDPRILSVSDSEDGADSDTEDD